MKIKLIKKGAMFGLDARIALAIFSALSVISGAALYSAIQNAKATALLTDLKEVGKAWEQYYLDTGTILPVYGSASYNEKVMSRTYKLISSSVDGWKGPYLTYEQHASPGDYLLKHPIYNEIHVLKANDLTWGEGDSWQVEGICESGKQCFFWVAISGLSTSDKSSIANMIDKIVDGGDGDDVGNFRVSGTTIFLKYAPADI
jgi:hypothetical protein